MAVATVVERGVGRAEAMEAETGEATAEVMEVVREVVRAAARVEAMVEERVAATEAGRWW